MAQNEPSLEHDFFVRTLAVWLERNGYAVGTCLEEQEQDKPPPLNGHRPDVYAMKRGSPSVIGLVELCERLHDESTRERWQAVFAAANRPSCRPSCSCLSRRRIVRKTISKQCRALKDSFEVRPSAGP